MGTFLDRFAQVCADLLVRDRCHLCGRPPAANTRGMAAPVEVRVAGLATVRSHPLCPSCVRDLEPSEPVPDASRVDGMPVVSAFVTTKRLLDIIHLIKFRRVRLVADLLGAAMSSAATRLPGAVDALVPVPMDRRALRRRGFNQAEYLADVVGAALGIPVAPGGLVKLRRTRTQSLATRSDRLRNVRGAFVPGPETPTLSRVVLVDDLVTTGATASACAAALRSGGARPVAVLCGGLAP